MKLQLTRIFLAAAFFCIAFLSARSQLNICPPNLDFEFGNFSNWECKTGTAGFQGNAQICTNPSLTCTNVANLTSCCSPVPNRHEIIPSTSTAIDPWGLFPVVCPNGSNYSVKLGNQLIGAQAEGLVYTY